MHRGYIGIEHILGVKLSRLYDKAPIMILTQCCPNSETAKDYSLIKLRG